MISENKKAFCSTKLLHLFSVQTRMLVSNPLVVFVYVYSIDAYFIENKSDDRTKWHTETVRKFCERASFVLSSCYVCAVHWIK